MLSKAIQLSILYLLALQNEVYPDDVFGEYGMIRPFPRGHLKPGNVINISFKRGYYSWEAAINIQESEKRYEGDIGLHIKFRFFKKTITLDYYTNGEYQKDYVFEDLPLVGRDGDIPFYYNVGIKAMEDHYDIVIDVSDNTKVLSFPYKTDISKLKYVEVYGDGHGVIVHSIRFQ